MPNDRQSFEKITLPNGINLYLHAMEVPFTQVHVLVPVGNVHSHQGNPGGVFGSAHFLEHMCFERSALYPEKHQFENIISGTGGEWNAWTTPYFTDYYLQATAKSVTDLLSGFISHIFSPLLHSEDIETQIGIVLNESAQRKFYPGDDELSHYRYQTWMRTQYYDKEQLFGTKQSLGGITNQSLALFHQYYRQPGINVLVGGEIPRSALQDLFSTLETNSRTLHVAVEEPTWLKREYHTIESREIDAPVYFWGGNFAGASLNDLAHISFICDYLTDHESGLLNTWIRKEEGWSYGVNSWNWFDRDRLGWTIEIPVSTANAVEQIRTEIHRRVEAGLADVTRIEATKKRLQNSTAFSFQTLGDRLERAVEMLGSFGHIPTEAEYRQLLTDITPSSLGDAYLRLFSPEQSGELLALPIR